jgi:hypothetical protein
MEVGQGPNWGCSAKGKQKLQFLPLGLKNKTASLQNEYSVSETEHHLLCLGARPNEYSESKPLSFLRKLFSCRSFSYGIIRIKINCMHILL